MPNIIDFINNINSYFLEMAAENHDDLNLYDGEFEDNIKKHAETSIKNENITSAEIYKELESSINSLTESSEISETERDQVIKARIGQMFFKKALLHVEKKCKLCGVSSESFLIASHNKPWSKSEYRERLDVNNGFLLCPNHDVLFDKGYISFKNNAEISISDDLDEVSKVFLDIDNKLKIQMNNIQQQYIKWHRDNVFLRKIV
ncbi:hypothetical protein BN1058_00875 [Paraliobacillus sp. PM-2]|uniref:HNH endonuclease n=1 Tax=Paraliobacillus sp. PM-2 TaxID=1462524 RepID=UPI00061C14C2|nr:HNH endonuclease [Paraliobacillus sp. PM-2]CQR46606.1 hypothetical protein BN1058_00875 [Paraliobacillus sp. PM-2]